MNIWTCRFLPIMVSLLAVLLHGRDVARAAETKLTTKGVEFFESKIRPILVQRCYACHSARADEVKGGLRLDSRDGLLKGGESGAAVVPGNVDESLLIQAIRYETYEMPPGEKLPEDVIRTFEEWVEMGAPDPRSGTSDGKKLSLAEARDFWSFKSPIITPPGALRKGKWARSEIDRYVMSKMEDAGLTPVSDTDRSTLIRRLTFDLTGLPPTIEDVESFTAPGSKISIEEVVDKLLESQQFGERWGRHWLDVVRFGESAGKERNVVFSQAWRYRDYVIDALNSDKPYDRFIREQIAGDLLQASSVAEHNENLIATGFLAIGTKGLNERNKDQYTMDVVDEQIDATTRAILGITVACARCHDHKFDPISANDYYAMAGIFRSTEVLAGVRPGNNKTGYEGEMLRLMNTSNKRVSLTDEQRAEISKLEEELKDVREKLGRARTVLTAAKNGNLKKKGKGKQVSLEKVKQSEDRLEQRVKTIESQIVQIRKYPDGDGDPVMAVRDVGRPENCRLHIRGEVKELGPEVPRGIPFVLSFDRNARFDTNQSGRAQLASWLASKNNPLTARVAVNRIWSHLFGAGIVDPPDNFGALGMAPSHPELLDYLALRLIENGWSTKKLIREIALSRTYQLGSEHDDANYAKDPDNRLLWRMNRRRLEAESIRDAVLAVSGRLDTYRPQGSPAEKLGGQEIGRGRRKETSVDYANMLCRSVYLPMFRNYTPEVLSVFDMADPSLIVPQREITTVATQALFMMNSPFVIDNSNHLAKRLATLAGRDEAHRLEKTYLLLLGRKPSPSEASRSLNFLREYHDLLEPTNDNSQPSKNQSEPGTSAWAVLCQSIIASGEFRYLY